MVIDFSVRPPHRSFMDDFYDPPDYLKGYAHLYADRFNEVNHFLHAPIEEFFDHLNSAEVHLAVISGKDNETLHGRKIANDVVSEIVNKYPDRFVGFAGVDPLKGMDAVREIERAVKDLGLVGVAIEPFEYNMYPDDRKMYPIYAKCVELGIPISLHCSINFSTERKMDYGHPQYIDTVAVDFPELKLIAMTPGWPWVNELIGVAWRHPNVYIQTAAMRPKYMNMPNTGWQEIVHYGNTVIQDKMLFASGWPLLPIKRSIDEIKGFPLKQDVQEKWLHKNACSLLTIEL
ncbi:amidohydrolase family protein [Pseudogracilibacillus auburnensis]|uniref:Amidohydrolase-related domain-containing protein n=1 Tax=Pseudogracilibacillus auburnensis TaxID=1494959 RepID=A0A2V3WDG4_9BACI|nr:amidohydrolase family protein [Pseudogracilibacillus auburnensis]MBO1002007.1 amidohydrolase [Pseudogracilibacillus auburnensis]PXW90235.1 hypothetical protein DFR56_101146 [Pseudogracilibacillus auburnensis]